jgi:ferrous iron transport protein B
MELPAYHLPTVVNVLRSMWERAWSFIKKAGTIILLASVVVWFASNFGWESSETGAGAFGMVDASESMLAAIGSAIAWIFTPLGWGNWQSAVAALTGIIAKENIVATFGILYGFAEAASGVSGDGTEMWRELASSFTMLSAYSFLVFNLLCAPCVAAIAAIRREMNNAKWFWFAIGYQCVFAYTVSLCIYQLGMMFAGSFGLGSVAAILLTGLFLYMLFRKQKEAQS